MLILSPVCVDWRLNNNSLSGLIPMSLTNVTTLPILFVVEKNSLKVTSPDKLKDTYECAIGNFGIPQYGGTLVGAVIHPKSNQRAMRGTSHTVHTCQVGLLKHLKEVKDAVNELEGLVEDVTVELGTATENLAHLHYKDSRNVLDPPGTTSDEEIMLSSDTQKPEITDYATMMAVIYSMVKQDYVMQEKIISALNLNSTFEELESYSLMWSLRPYIDDEVMHQAWRLIH